MELQELVERIQRWRLRQPSAYAEEPAEAAPVESAEEQIAELDVDPDGLVSEDATSELAVEQIEEVD
jgi:hypothetical protein